MFSHVGDEGTIESCAADLLRYRRNMGAEHIQIFTDIKKKHRSAMHSFIFFLKAQGDLI